VPAPSIVAFLSAATVAAVLAPTWTPETSGVTARLRGISAASVRVAWSSGAASTVLRTEDGGLTWDRRTVTPDRLDFRDIDAVDPNTAYVLSIGNGPLSRIYKTTDGGQTWDLQFKNDDPHAFLDAMAFWDARHGLVVGDSIEGAFYLLRTEDGGQTWARIPSGALPPALPNEGAFAASGTNIATYGSREAWVGTGAASRARVLHTRDGGRSWTIAETPIASGASAGIYSVAFRDAQHGVVVGGDYTQERAAVENVAVTTDGGQTWLPIADHGLSGFRSVVAYVPGVSPAVVVAVGPAGSDLSEDDGRTWTPIAGPGFDTLSFAPGQPVGWASGARGSLARLTLAAPGGAARSNAR
jgi:photosystem II stability/assembly factor-like uncharacterized protein